VLHFALSQDVKDLNYRLDLPADEIREIIQESISDPSVLRLLLQSDQVTYLFIAYLDVD
jgi:hypothetical protein